MTLQQAIEDIECGHNLACYAAGAAARELAQNWRDATRDGAVLRKMVADDVDATIRELRRLKEIATEV
jgi:hypothetical protein